MRWASAPYLWCGCRTEETPCPASRLVTEVARLGRRLDDCEAVLELQALKARYGELVDRRFRGGQPNEDETMAGLAERIALLFTEDGVRDGGPGLGEVTRRRAIAERLGLPTLSFARHLFVNPRIDARERWNLLSPCRRPSYWMCGYQDDEYVRVDRTWLHRAMRLTTVFMSLVGEGLGQDSGLNTASDGARPSFSARTGCLGSAGRRVGASCGHGPGTMHELPGPLSEDPPPRSGPGDLPRV
jgi:hypothetical protein